MTTPERSVVFLQVGMTHAEARLAVAVVWPEVVLHLYHPTPSFYKEGFPYREDAWTQDDDVLKTASVYGKTEPPPDAVLISGTLPRRKLEEAILHSFRLMPDFDYRLLLLRGHGFDTLDEQQVFAEEMRAAFVRRHGCEPRTVDGFHGISLRSN